MITCPNCNAQNLPGMAYCENCGSPLPQQSAAAPATQAPEAPVAAAATPAPTIVSQPDPAAAVAPQPVMPVDQPPPGPDAAAPAPISGANTVAADAADAPAAASAPIDAAPAPSTPSTDQGTVAPPQPAVAPTTAASGQLTITFPSGQTFDMQGDEVNVGRADVAQGWHPELDVIPFGGGAPDLGVSRHQARIVREDSGFAVVNVGSTNGTYVNGKAATYNQSVPLNDGDTLSFGALNTQISIK